MTDVDLPPPEPLKSAAVFHAFRRRKTTRELNPKALEREELSALLWTAYGVNRRPGPFGLPGRTAASASNSQEIDLYVLMEDGAYLYDAVAHQLRAVAPGDLRSEGGTPGQISIGLPPVQLVYVADIDRLEHTQGFEEPHLHDPEMQKAYAYVDTGLIAGNVYLFAAAEGFGTWFHNCDREQLARDLKLGSRQRVLFAQSVGYPDGMHAPI